MLSKIKEIGLIGAANAGKSTLINFLTNQYVSIITKKPQTTINIISSKLIKAKKSVNLIDLPGFSLNQKLFNQVLNRLIMTTFKWVDIFFFISSCEQIISKPEQILLQKLMISKKKIFLIITKIDLVSEKILAKKINYFQKLKNIQKIIAISINKNKNLKSLQNLIDQFLEKEEIKNKSNSDLKYLTTKKKLFFCKEIIRKSIFKILNQELPYQTFVKIENCTENNNLLKINANLICAKKSQKKIIIGTKAATIKAIGIQARNEIEHYLNKKVYLTLFVKVDLNWISNLKTIQKITTF